MSEFGLIIHNALTQCESRPERMVICQMEVVIHFDHFYRMLVRCEPLSPEYAIMKRAELIPDSADGLNRKFGIRCRLEEAVTLLNLARQVYPEAVPDILASIAIERGAA